MKHITTKRTSIILIVLAAASQALAAGTSGGSKLDVGTVVLLCVLGIPVVAFSGYAGYLLFTGKSQRRSGRPITEQLTLSKQ